MKTGDYVYLLWAEEYNEAGYCVREEVVAVYANSKDAYRRMNELELDDPEGFIDFFVECRPVA